MHIDYLQQALALAESRRGFCAPNPAVGALIVKNHQVLAAGCHWQAGDPHAEADALNKLSLAETTGATLYVTLEPCCHTEKRTPPCTNLIIDRGITQVIYAMRDPNPKVAGRGEQQLLAAGIQCQQVSLSRIDVFYASYQFWLQQQRPFVTAKLALSLDGKIAASGGKPVAITGKELQRITHLYRKQSDAILTTCKTILQDDPQLNIRLEHENIRKPIYIMDSQLRLPFSAQIFRTTSKITLFYATPASLERVREFSARGVICVGVSSNAQGLNLLEILTHIGGDGVHDLWVEAGGKCFSTLIAENLVQKCLLYTAPIWLGETAQAAFQTKTDLLIRAKQVSWQQVGNDALCEIRYQ